MSNTELYDLLEVSPRASDAEIKKSYHKLARKHHPDRNAGNDDDKFKEIQSAYEILSDPQKRETYDRFGLSAVKGDDMPGDSPFGASLFSQMFGGDIFGMGGRHRRPKADTIGIPLEASLEEMYSGKTKEIEYKRKVLCKTCNGTGGKSGTVTKCRNCQGTGTQVQYRPIGPGMMQQIQSMCESCGGTGDYIREKDKCKKCKGKRLIEINHKQEVHIAMGMRHEQKIPLRGMADEMPDGDPGDVIVILQQMDHPTFKRVDCDLFVEKTISLKEALCGFTCTLDHLDGRKLRLSTSPGTVLSPGCVQGLESEGMPVYKRPDFKGHLYIKFTVEFPQTGFLQEDQIKLLQDLLPACPDDPVVGEDAEEVNMIDSEGTRGMDGGGAREAFDSDSDDDEGAGGPRMGCTQQ